MRIALLWWLPALAACVMLASCGLGGVSDNQPVLTQADILGTWSNHNGSTIAFTSGTSFTAVAMHITASFPPLPTQCDSVTDTGQWQFLSPQGDSAAEGNAIWLQFSQYSACNADLDTWEVDPPVGLCLNFDPDDPCMSIPWTKEP